MTKLPIVGGALQIIPVETVPAREAWLHKNPDALASVIQGSQEASNHQFVEPPDMDADADWADFEDHPTP